MDWYYAEDGIQVGPISDSEFEEQARSGRITPNTLVWHSGMSDWKPYREVSVVQSRPEATPVHSSSLPTKQCHECGKLFSEDEMIHYSEVWVCANCKPLFMQKLKEGMQISTTLNYAGFGIRVGAKIIDWLIMGVPLFMLTMIVGISSSASGDEDTFLAVIVIIQLISIVLPIVYNTFFIGKYAATPGKMICKLKVVRSDNDRVTYLRALGRYFGEGLSGMILYIGYLMVAFDSEECRALHDRICDTRVVYA